MHIYMYICMHTVYIHTSDRRGQEQHNQRVRLDVLENANKRLDMENAGARALIEKIDVERVRDDAERANLQEELEAAASNIFELQRGQEALRVNLANAKEGNTQLQDRVSVLTAQLHTRTSECAEFRQQMGYQEKELLEANAVLQRSRNEMVGKDAIIEQLSQQQVNLHAVLNQSKAEIANMHGEKDHLLTQALSACPLSFCTMKCSLNSLKRARNHEESVL